MINKALANYHNIKSSLPADLNPDQRAKELDKARFVRWDIASEYLNKMGKGKGGKDYERLAERMKRIRSCAISVVRKSATSEESLILPMIRSSRMPRWASGGAKKEPAGSLIRRDETEAPLGFELSQDFFNDFVQHHVPVPAEVIRVLLRRPKHLDLFTFLCWRGFVARSTTLIPISDLRQQIGTTDSNSRRLAADLKEVIEMAKTLGWKELNAQVIYDDKGRRVLKIGRPLNNVHYLPPVE